MENQTENQKEKFYRIPIYKVQLVRDSSYKSPEKKITDPASAYEIIKNYFAGIDREMFAVVMTDTKHKVIGINTVSVGSLDSSIVHPREVFKPAILSNASALILAHNHPSGDTTPSREDIQVTKRLEDAGKLLGITILDHIIVSDESYSSLKERGDI